MSAKSSSTAEGIQKVSHLQLLTVEQVAERLSVSTRTVRRLIDSGELPAHRMGRMVRVSVDDLERYIRGLRNV
jgi:excisionase family DNA binding protein